MTNPTPHGQVPEALRLAALLDADEWPGSMTLVSYARACAAELCRLHALTAQAPSQPGGFDAGDMASAAAQGFRDGLAAAQAISAEPAIPALQPVAWLVTGSYTKQAFPMHSSAVAFLKGLLSSDPDGGHKIVPLFILPQTATGDSGWEEHPANPGDTESGPEGEWYCETHPDQLMGHAGCGGAGIPACARIGMLMNQLRLTKQEVREANHMRDEMAAAALRASHGQAPAGAARADSVLEDAARYRWLRRWKGQEHEPPFTVQHEIDGTLWGGDLDAAIDAALAAQEGK